MTTGQRIKAARKKRGFTQAELAEKLGIPYQSIGQWERNIRNPKLGTLLRIAEALDVPIDELTDGLPVEATKTDLESLQRMQRHSRVQELILEIVRLQYGAAVRKELCYNGACQDYFLVGTPPEQFFLHNDNMELLVRAIPLLFERMKDTRPVDAIISEELGKLKRQSEYLADFLNGE